VVFNSFLGMATFALVWPAFKAVSFRELALSPDHLAC